MANDLELIPHVEEPEENSAELEASTDPEDFTDQFGLYAPWDWSPEPVWGHNTGGEHSLNDRQRNILQELVRICSRTDVAARRFEVEQDWEARLFERGYQHLVPRQSGGWQLPGENSRWGPLAVEDASGLYAVNIYGRDRDIIVGAMTREIPKVQFFPASIDSAASIDAAKAANDYKYIFEKNSDLRELLGQIASLYYTDGRIVFYTRHVLDAMRFGRRQEGSPEDVEGVPDALGVEITEPFGTLEAKVPIQAQRQRDMQFVQLYDEIDINMAKATCPWIAKKLAPGSNGIGEVQLDRIARINTKLALVGSYVTGDSLERDVTRQRTWIRPSMFWETDITSSEREWFLENFPKGALITFMGATFGFARNESMDDYLKVSHAYPGIGQNRRAIGSSGISVQKRNNNYFDLEDDFIRNTVPRKWYDAETFDVEALKEQDNEPGSSGPFERPTNATSVQDLVFVEPTPQPQPTMVPFMQWVFGDVSAAMTGAVPSLYGGPIQVNTPEELGLSNRDMALGRIGVCWNAAKAAFATVFHQAARAAAEARQEMITGIGKDGKFIQIDPDLLRGDVVCYPEFDSGFPESWTEREARYTEIVAGAASNPFYAKMLDSPKNIRAIADNIRMAELRVPGEQSVEKAMKAINALKVSAPLPNPKLQALQQALTVAQAETATNPEPDPGVGQAVQEIQQQIQSTPPLVPSIPVAEDASENHAVEAATCFEWMNGDEGQQFKHGLPEQQQGYANVHLYWQAHEDMAQKLAPPPANKPESVSINFKDMPPDAQTQALMKAGLQTTPQAIQTNELIKTHRKIAEKVVPRTIPDTIRVVRRGSNGSK